MMRIQGIEEKNSLSITFLTYLGQEILFTELFPWLDPRSILQLSIVSKEANILIKQFLENNEKFELVKRIAIEAVESQDLSLMMNAMSSNNKELKKRFSKLTLWKVLCNCCGFSIPTGLLVGGGQQQWIATDLTEQFKSQKHDFLSTCFNSTPVGSFPTCDSYLQENSNEITTFNCQTYTLINQCDLEKCLNLFNDFCQSYKKTNIYSGLLFSLGAIIFLLAFLFLINGFQKKCASLQKKKEDKILHEVFNDSAFKENLSQAIINLIEKYFDTNSLTVNQIFYTALDRLNKINARQINVKSKFDNISLSTIFNNFIFFKSAYPSNEKPIRNNSMEDPSETTPLLMESGRNRI